MPGNQDQTFSDVGVLNNIVEAQLIGSILDERHIPYRIQSYHDTAYDGLFQFQKGWGQIFAPAEFKQEIIEILEELRSQKMAHK